MSDLTKTAADAIAEGKRMHAEAVGARPRFSKATLAAHCERRIAYLEETYGFDPSNGWNQVNGRGEERNRAYGEYSALYGVLEEFCS